MPLILEALTDTPVAERRIELCERKGLGHPDTICDSLVEAVSVALNRMYLDRVGAIAALQHRQGAAGGGPVREGLRLGRGDPAHAS